MGEVEFVVFGVLSGFWLLLLYWGYVICGLGLGGFCFCIFEKELGGNCWG